METPNTPSALFPSRETQTKSGERIDLASCSSMYRERWWIQTLYHSEEVDSWKKKNYSLACIIY